MTPTVAVTGIALATALGGSLDATREALLAGRAAFTETAATDGLYPGTVRAPAGALADDLSDVPAFGRRRLRALSQESLLVSRVGMLAWQDAGFEPDMAPDPEETAVVLGTASGGLSGYLQVMRDGLVLGPELVSPYAGPQGSLNAAASDLSIAAGAQGSIVTVTAGRCSGAHALTVAADYLRTGQAQAVLVAAVDVLDPLRLATGRAHTPPGEAVVVFVVEDTARARSRGARVHVEITGLSTLRGGADGQGASAPAIAAALADAGAGAGDLALVLSSSAGDPPLPGGTGAGSAVHGPLDALGDCAGATTLLQVALAARALAEGRVPRAVDGPRDVGSGRALVLTTDEDGQAAAVVVHRR
ncbi:3-oxoacyl-[acyl-carrier-protein] synthase II [Streptomyces sp. Ncost-T6T-1]|uniref:beta-ketoacyl synthase N-terminal-like domain-containing protein n=1 Tax=Streptomyces sp. Ncost-T6T-1 TaxID=1100828 RepID=UPI000804BA6B|nr:beta-ketoacyl synthase N-terminal-like domain-containing protein [Streptomyces sp. Ncost-T6T-1]SBU98612.1 3-oxoacyl-[acyl-carrier-protein] synthase II [Streptomyces sp. Ncost-T6T-1]